MAKSIFRKGIATAVALTLALSVLVPSSFAATPKKKDVEYKGKGVVEVEFRGDVRYNKAKVIVEDTDGNSYKTRIIERDDDELKFKVKNYKVGKTYTFKISGVKKEYTKKYGTVTGKFTIKKTIGKKAAKEIALKHFINKLNGTKRSIEEIDVDYEAKRNRYEVSIETYKGVEFEYFISANSGKILRMVEDWD